VNRNLQLVWNGFIPENPIFRLALSLCPAVAVTTSVKNGLYLGLSVLVVQVMSSLTASVFKSVIHPRIRIPAYVIIIATWVSIIDMVMPVISPPVYNEIKLFVALIVVFAIIISRMELFASKEPVLPSFFDGFGMGIGFTFGLCLTAAIRELFGSGTLYGFDVLGFKPLLIMILPAGGFFVIGFIMATFNWVEYMRTGKVPRAAGGH
jgi:Na+-translocating ferredoxin:NAD+ oxidoreductase subunit E